MSMKHRLIGAALAIVLSGFLVVSLGSRPAEAQADPTPAAANGVRTEQDGPLPSQAEGNAVWSIGDRTYAGVFPDGLRFEIAASSDQGAIVSARVIWTHAPGTQTRRSAGARLDADTGRWVAVWEPGTNQVPPWVLVRYHWELVDEQGNRYSSEEIDEVYADSGNAGRWKHLESEDVVVYWIDLPDEFGTRTVQAMSERREFYRQAWGGLLPYRPRVILYGWQARDEYEKLFSQPVFVGSVYVAGTTDADWGGTVQLAGMFSPADETAYGTVLHEVAHLYQHQFTRVTVDWFIEGDAEFFSLSRSGNYRGWARDRLSSREPLSFAAGFSTDGVNYRDGYWMGTTVWDYLTETYGLDAHRQVWELIAANVPRFEAIERVTGRSILEFEQDWRAWLGVFTPPPTLVPSPTPRFDILSWPTPTLPALSG